MATSERIEQITQYRDDAKEVLARATAERSRLLELNGVVHLSGLDQAIASADNAALQYQRVVIFWDSVLGRAAAGEDV